MEEKKVPEIPEEMKKCLGPPQCPYLSIYGLWELGRGEKPRYYCTTSWWRIDKKLFCKRPKGVRKG